MPGAHAHAGMEAVDVGRMLLGLEITLILVHAGAAGGCTVSVSQPPLLEVDPTQGAVTLPCSFSTAGCPAQRPDSLWFRLGTQQPERLCSEGGCTGEADKFTLTAPAQSQVSLTVNRLVPNDSAIYICGIALPESTDPQARRTGAGTVLVVRGSPGLSRALQGLLIALLLLLSVYLAAVIGIFIVLSKSKSSSLRNKEMEDSQKKSARRIFQEIAQELYSKRHAGTSQQPEKDNMYENRRARYNYERP